MKVLIIARNKTTAKNYANVAGIKSYEHLTSKRQLHSAYRNHGANLVIIRTGTWKGSAIKDGEGVERYCEERGIKLIGGREYKRTK